MDVDIRLGAPVYGVPTRSGYHDGVVDGIVVGIVRVERSGTLEYDRTYPRTETRWEVEVPAYGNTPKQLVECSFVSKYAHETFKHWREAYFQRG